MEYVQLKNDSVFKIGIRNAEGKDTGEYIEIDLEDIELPLKAQQCFEENKNNYNWIKAQFLIIDKKQDKKGKKLLSANEEAKIKALSEFYKRQENAWNLFLGEGAIKKILCGRKPYFTLFEELDEQLSKLIPKFKEKTTTIEEKIKAKYGKNIENDVMK